MQFYEMANQLLEDFPEITLMEKNVFSNTITYSMPNHSSSCIDISGFSICIYFTVPRKYEIYADDKSCEIMFTKEAFNDFALIGKYQKSDMNQWWTYKNVKEDVKRMLEFQKKVNGYISLLNYRSSIKNEHSIVIDI